jgi:hypothetical protein
MPTRQLKSEQSACRANRANTLTGWTRQEATLPPARLFEPDYAHLKKETRSSSGGCGRRLCRHTTNLMQTPPAQFQPKKYLLSFGSRLLAD